MLPRTLEPEVMDSMEEARDYNAMDHSAVNRVFVDDLLEFCSTERVTLPASILDVGTGTALIPLELSGRGFSGRITAIDLAGHMLTLAQQNVDRAGRTNQIVVEQQDAKALTYAAAAFEAVVSNSIVHHIPEPFSVLREMVRVLRPGGILFVRDLLRPEAAATVDQLVATYAADANRHQRAMFHASLHAALTLDEVRGLLKQIGMSPAAAQQTSDRHWTVAWRAPVNHKKQ